MRSPIAVLTVIAGLAAAETGHFVMSTLHTTDAAETITRVIDFFPPHEQKQVRLSLAGALRGIICQRLVPRADGQGRCVAMEICVATGRIADRGAAYRRPALRAGSPDVRPVPPRPVTAPADRPIRGAPMTKRASGAAIRTSAATLSAIPAPRAD